MSNVSFAQPDISIEKYFGGRNFDLPTSFQQTSDNGYIIGGETGSVNGDLSHEVGSPDVYSLHRSYNKAWVLKLDKNLNIEWSKTYGKSTYDKVVSIIQTSEGDYIFTSTKSTRTSGHKENWWVTKLDSLGYVKWEKSLGSEAKEEAFSIIESNNGEFIVLGSEVKITYEKLDDRKLRRNDTSNVLITKINSEGDIKWQKNIGGKGRDHCQSIKRCMDGNFIIIGETDSEKIDNLDNHGNMDLWIFKISNEGKLIWQKLIGGSEYDSGSAIAITKDEGFIVAGSIYSMPTASSIRTRKANKGAGYTGAWVVKLDKNGEIEWEKTYEEYKYKKFSSVDLTDDGGYVFSGYSRTFSKDLKKQLTKIYSPENTRNGGAFVIKTNIKGNQEWFKILGEGSKDFIYDIKQISKDKYFCLGSIEDENPNCNGFFDIWALELQPKKIMPKINVDEKLKEEPKKKIELFNCKVDTQTKSVLVTIDESIIGAQYFIMKNRRKTGLMGTIDKLITNINIESQGTGKFMFVIRHRGKVSNQKFEIE